mgnify:CR=1 FL=1
MPTNQQNQNNAYYLSTLSEDERKSYYAEQERLGRTNAAITGGAGIADIIGGGRAQNVAEGDIEAYGAESDAIREHMRNLKTPGSMDAETTASAVRNATILGGVGNLQDDSSEAAAVKMAIDAGVDPAVLQRNYQEGIEQKSLNEQLKQQGAFREGLGFAQGDANAAYQKEMDDLYMDYDETQGMINSAQQASLMGQQQKQKGTGNLVAGGVGYLQDGGMEQIGGLLGGGGGGSDAQMSYGGEGDIGGLLEGLGNFGGANGMRVPYEDGGVVQKTPGVFKHDDGDGEFQEGENEMILMAQEAGGLVDTGIRQTGGEFVINPKQAKGMEKAYDRAKKKKNPSKADLMALFEAVRFLDEPQFD